MKRSRRKRQYIFTLKNINPDDIEKRFGITLISNIDTLEDVPPLNTTHIDELSNGKHTPEVVSFIDESKTSRKCMVVMVDIHNGGKITKENVNRGTLRCFWDRYPIKQNVHPIGCPIRYIPNVVKKSYYSEISKDKYVIQENITRKTRKKIIKQDDKRLKVEEKAYYQTDGIFCSFNCCMAYIEDNTHNPMYDSSQKLLLRMYKEVNEVEIPEIDIAPSWRLLKENGGHMTIEKFRDSFGKIDYEYHGIADIPKMKSVGRLYEEKLKF